VQKKLLAYHDGTGFHPAVKPVDPATHIAKFNREDLPSLVLNESSTLQLGREVLGSSEITKAERAQLRGFDGIALLVERFDRHGHERLRLEDLAQILSKPRGRDFNGKYQSSYEEAAGAITKYSARSRIDLARYFALVVFNMVVGNADAHLKNFSLLERPEGLRLSPAYDLVNTTVYPEYERSAALEIGGRKRAFAEIDRPLLENLGRDIGLPDRAVKKAIDDLAKGFASAPTLKPRNHVQPGEFRETYRETIINNAERMLA
jgi:serine/threonine-protein kinase HipA